MRLYKNIAVCLSLFTVLFFVSCEKKLEFDAQDFEAKYIIEAPLYTEGVSHSFQVQVTRTASFTSPDVPERISGAVISLTDPEGQVFTLDNEGEGHYALDGYFAQTPGRYMLRVEIGNEVFTAESNLLRSIPIDSVNFTYEESSFFDTTFSSGYQARFYFNDPAEEENYYTYDHWVNGEPVENEWKLYMANNDKYTNGNTMAFPVFALIQPGESCSINLYHIEKSLYDYISGVQSARSNSFSPAPANPITNIKGGAIGYFGLYAASKMSVVAPDTIPQKRR